MKLSDFKGEDAIDVLADLMQPAVAIATDESIQEAYQKKDVGDLFSFIMKKYKTEVLNIYGILTKENPKEATPIKLLNMFSDIMQDEELKSLFFSQGQNPQDTHSGSVTENTEENEK